MSDDRRPRAIGAPIEPPPIADLLPWRAWEEGRAEAQRTGRPLVVFAEPDWTTSSQRLALHLWDRPQLRAWLEDHWVCVSIDPWHRPDLADHLRFEAAAITGDPGPPLLVMLDARMRPFLAFGTLRYEGAADHPSLDSLLRTASELHAEEPQRLEHEADERARRSQTDGTAGYDRPSRLVAALLADADGDHGGFRGATKLPQPQALLLLLDAHARHPSERIAALLETTLTGLEQGGIRDQLGYGFHRAARDERWVVPHFEKPVPLNAALATAFGRAGRAFGITRWLELARDTLQWVTTALEAGWDSVAADSGYYTWTTGEIRRVVTPDVLQALGIHYHLNPSPLRMVLHQAVPADRLAAFSRDDPELLGQRLADGRGQLRAARHQRPAPATLAAPGWSWHADALAMAYACARVLEHDTSVLDRVSELLAQQIDRGASIARADGAIYLEDEAAVAHALLRASNGGGGSLHLTAAKLLDRILRRLPRDGGELPLRTSDPSTDESPMSRFGVVDHDVTSSIAHLLAALRLAAAPFAAARGRVVTAHRPAAAVDPVRAAGFWREASSVDLGPA